MQCLSECDDENTIAIDAMDNLEKIQSAQHEGNAKQHQRTQLENNVSMATSHSKFNSEQLYISSEIQSSHQIDNENDKVCASEDDLGSDADCIPDDMDGTETKQQNVETSTAYLQLCNDESRSKYTMDGHISAPNCKKKKLVEEYNDITIDFSAKLPPSPFPIKSYKTKQHPPKHKLLRPLTVGHSQKKKEAEEEEGQNEEKHCDVPPKTP